MFTCFAYDTISEAACASQRLHTISFGHAMCHLLFPLTRRVFSPCHIFCPFVATCVAKGFCSQPKFCHSICRLCFCPRHVFANVFLPPVLPLHLPPSVFSIHVALQIATAIAIAFALKVAIFVAIKFGRLIEHCSWILDNLWIYHIFFWANRHENHENRGNLDGCGWIPAPEFFTSLVGATIAARRKIQHGQSGFVWK